ncbi:unnamed protein product, partial [Brassica rapa]
ELGLIKEKQSNVKDVDLWRWNSNLNRAQLWEHLMKGILQRSFTVRWEDFLNSLMDLTMEKKKQGSKVMETSYNTGSPLGCKYTRYGKI